MCSAASSRRASRSRTWRWWRSTWRRPSWPSPQERRRSIVSSQPAALRPAPLLPILVLQTGSELVRFIRIPAASLLSIGLPILFFAFFGLSHVSDRCGPVDCGSYLLAQFGAYAVTSMMVLTFGISVAIDRGARINVLFRATPLPASLLLLAK